METTKDLCSKNINKQTPSPFSSVILETVGDDGQTEKTYLEIKKDSDSPPCRKPLFSFNPNNFPYSFTYDEPTDVLLGETLPITDSVVEQAPLFSEAFHMRIGLKRSPIYLEDTVNEVKLTTIMGCSCVAKNCFEDLSPDAIFKHRVDMSKLTKYDREIFLMGTVTTCLTSVDGPKKFMKYMYRGKRVCKDAFLYLNFCTQQQLTNIRNRVAGNERDAQQNEFVDETYKSVKDFLKRYIREHIGRRNIDTPLPLLLPLGTTKTDLYEAYKKYYQKLYPGEVCMDALLFRSILSKDFPNVMFRKCEYNLESPHALYKNNKKNGFSINELKPVSPFDVIPPGEEAGQVDSAYSGPFDALEGSMGDCSSQTSDTKDFFCTDDEIKVSTRDL